MSEKRTINTDLLREAGLEEREIEVVTDLCVVCGHAYAFHHYYDYPPVTICKINDCKCYQ